MQCQSIIAESPLREAPRSGNRLGRTPLLTAEAVAHELLRGIDDPAEDNPARASRLSFVAQQRCTAHVVHVTGKVPRQPLALVGNHVSYLVTHMHLHFLPALEVSAGGEERCAKHARDQVRAWVAPHAQA